ncbi:MAG: hypothetical protein AVDCRST_MAG68-3248, partial [uncultured Gemmatimonadetes bacterium]
RRARRGGGPGAPRRRRGGGVGGHRNRRGRPGAI